MEATTDYSVLAANLHPYRPLLAEWHGGQWTDMYGFQSSGIVTNPQNLMREINDCVFDADWHGLHNDAAELSDAAQIIYIWLHQQDWLYI